MSVMQARPISLGRALRDAINARARTTNRTVAGEIRYLATLGISAIFASAGEGGIPRELFDRPELEPGGRQHVVLVRATNELWRHLEALAAACSWLRTPKHKAWRNGPLLVRGRPQHLSRAMRIAVKTALEILAEDPSLDPAPRLRRRYIEALRRAYGDWNSMPDWSAVSIELEPDTGAADPDPETQPPERPRKPR